MAQKYDIFISYRRKGGVKDARLVDEKLRNSGYSVSFDIDTLGRGKFTDTLNTRLKGCKDFIVIFEPSYYERFYDENGHIQPEEVLEEDWCYLELKNALLFSKNIIPLVQKDFVFPRNLPKGVKDIAEMNAIQLTEKEFKEIFEYKVKSYLVSKPKFTYQYRKPIIATMLFAIVAIIAYLVNFGLESQRKAAEGEKRTVFVADSISKASTERSAFVADSIQKLGDARAMGILDSIKAKEAKEAEKRKAAAQTSSAPAKTELYWVSNGDESGKAIFEKLSGAGLKTGKCSGNGIKVSASSKPSCKPNAMGTVKCSYTPQLTASSCEGSQIDKFTFSRELNGSSKDEAVAKQKLLEELEKVNLSEWVGKLKSLRR
jgi:hypothetical protein